MWLAMTTGARRGELCALRWQHLQAVHAERGRHDCIAAGCRWVLVVRRAIGQAIADGEVWEKDTKTHQQRRIALDPETVAVLTGSHQPRTDPLHLLRCHTSNTTTIHKGQSSRHADLTKHY